MVATESSFKNNKGYDLAFRLRTPDHISQPKGTALLMHGYDGHKDRPYITAMEDELNKNGYATFAYNMTGCGGTQGDLSELTPLQGYHDLRYAAQTVQNLPGINPENYILYANSFSVMPAVKYASDEDRLPLKSLVLHAPVPNTWRALGKLVAGAWWRKGGKSNVGDFFYNLADMLYHDLWKKDPAAAKKAILELELDPENRFRFPSCFGSEMNQLDLYDTAQNVDVPVFIAYGEKDELASQASNQRLVQAFKKSARVIAYPVTQAAHFFDEASLGQFCHDSVAAVTNFLLPPLPQNSVQNPARITL